MKPICSYRQFCNRRSPVRELSKWLACIVALAFTIIKSFAAGEDVFYKLGPDSLPQDGVPQGKLIGPATLPSEVFPGTQHTYWIYVPAQYDPKEPAALLV